MPSVKYSLTALYDLQRLKDFLASKNPAAAERVKQTILASLKILQQQPYAGKVMRDMPEQFREWNIKFGQSGYVALYYAEDNHITILAIRHQKEAGYISPQPEP
jgi:plasmid stabilization system protein ParE